MSKVDQIFNESKSILDFTSGYFSYLKNLIDGIDHNTIEEIITVFLEARESGKTIYFIGNGGSAATCSQFANDIGFGTRTYKKPFKVLSLTDNNAVLTALGNDEGYGEIFKKQLEVLATKDDIVVAISASGNSPNIVKALEYASELGCKTIGLSGFDGGKLKQMTDICLHVDSPKGDYGPVEDLHMIFDHLISNYLMRKVREEL